MLHVASATQFAAQIEEHKTLDGQTRKLATKEHVYLPMDIGAHFDKPFNKYVLCLLHFLIFKVQ